MRPFILPDKVYEVIKWILCTVVNPLITFLFALNFYCHFNWPMDSIAGVIAATATFLGAIFGISYAGYKKLNSGAEIPHEEGTNKDEL